jgi:hypothetical protein
MNAYHSLFIPEGVAEASQIFLRDAHVLPMFLAFSNTADFRALEGKISRWSRLHLQSLAPTPVSRRVDVRQTASRKNNCRIFSQNDEKHLVPTPLSVEKG